MEELKNLEYYSKNNDFNKGQIWEIKQGLESGVNVDIYANEKFNWRQMQQIFLGLVKNIDVKVYADPKYTAKQMKEIRTGLIEKIDITKYADSNLSANEMAQIRNELTKLKNNTDNKILSNFLDREEMKKIQKQLLDKWVNNEKDDTDFINEYIYYSLLKQNILINHNVGINDIETKFKKIKDIKFNVSELCDIYQAIINNENVLSYIESIRFNGNEGNYHE